MPSVPWEIIECQVDWLTLTSPSSEQDDRLLQVAKLIERNLLREDPTVCDWHWRGYTGKRGQHFAYGERYDSNILQLSGEIAHAYFDLAYNRATKCTRIDLAVTVRYDGGREGVARGVHKDGCQFDQARGQTRQRTLIVGSDGGSTAYIGDRASDLYARVYDKWREDGGERYRYCWRFEVEAKGDIAGRIGARLNSVADRQRECADIVSTHFKRRGVRADWMAGCRELRIPLARPASGTATRLDWLYNAVRPVIRKLIPIVGEVEILEALGLDPKTIERARVAWYDKLESHSLDDGLSAQAD